MKVRAPNVPLGSSSTTSAIDSSNTHTHNTVKHRGTCSTLNIIYKIDFKAMLKINNSTVNLRIPLLPRTICKTVNSTSFAQGLQYNLKLEI